MSRFCYWIENILKKNDNYCRHFCPNCEYFEICAAEKEIFNEPEVKNE